MDPDEGIELDVVPETGQEGAIGSRNQQEDSNLDADEGDEPAAAGMEDCVANTKDLGFLAQAKRYGQANDRRKPQVRAVPAEQGGQWA